MSVQIGTSGKNYSIAGGDRVSVCNSVTNLPYSIVINTTDNTLEMWKGDAPDPINFSKQDLIGQPAPPNVGDLFKASAICIDSSNIIRVLVWVNIALDVGGRGLYYATFNTTTDQWSSGLSLAQAAHSAVIPPIDPGVACAITNGDLQVFYTDMNTSRAVVSQHTFYTFYNGTSWSTKFLLAINSAYPSICIGATNNLPMVSVVIFTTPAAATISAFIGNQANATSFSLKSPLSNVSYASGIYNRPQICQDTIGDIWVAYLKRDSIGTNNLPYVIQHKLADAWGTWQTEVNVGNMMGQYITLSTRGYGKFVNDKNVIIEANIGIDPLFNLLKYDDYNTFQGNTWSPSSEIQTDSHKDPKTFWAPANGGYDANQHSVLQYVYAKDGGGTDQIWFDWLSLNRPT